ncbi:MAG: SLOG family protein [Rikenellaceae bacterium]
MNKSISVAFTGYRESKILRSKRSKSILSTLFGGGDRAILNQIADKIYNTIESLYDQGFLHFYCGMSSGFDLMAAVAVLELRNKYPDVKLIAVVPFKGQEERYSDKDKQTYRNVMETADEVVTLAERHTDNAQYLRRNDYMLEQSSHLVCYYDGQRGGTMYTYNRAVKTKMSITNICKYR